MQNFLIATAGFKSYLRVLRVGRKDGFMYYHLQAFPIKCKISRTSSARVTVVMSTHPSLLAQQSLKTAKKGDKSTPLLHLYQHKQEIKIRYKILTIFPCSTCKCEIPINNKGKNISNEINKCAICSERRQASFTHVTLLPSCGLKV